MPIRVRDDTPNLLTLREASAALNCHPNTLRQWDKDGVLIAVRLGKRGDRRYRRGDIFRLLGERKRTKGSYDVVSLFTGCGGLDLGFVGGFTFLGKKYPKRKFSVAWANDNEKDFCDTFEANFGHKIARGDIVEVLADPDNGLPARADVVLGGFPCQDFSLAGKRKGFGNGKRGLLYRSMVEVVRRTKPLVFVGENVKGLINMDGGRALATIVEDFEKLGYHVRPKLYLAADYGVPQMRERVIIVGTDKEKLPPFRHPDPVLSEDRWITAREAIADLIRKREGSAPNHYWSKAKMFEGTQGNTFIDPSKPGPTMRAEHHGNIEWLWTKKRRLSAREAARIQSFPDDFIFPVSTSSAYKQIGNAVPPVMAWHVATSVQEFLDEHL